MTPVVTADRFKCHLREGVVRKAVVWILTGSRSWLDIAGSGGCSGKDQKVSLLWSDACSQQEQYFLEKLSIFNRNLHKQVCCPVENSKFLFLTKNAFFFLLERSQPHPQWGTMTRNILISIWKAITWWHRAVSWPTKTAEQENLPVRTFGFELKGLPPDPEVPTFLLKNLHSLGGLLGCFFIWFVCLFV